MTKAILLFGPTASGKTALAIELAKAFNGEIVNADSRQLYKNMPIITAMPTREEFAEAPHHLFECLETNAEFSVAEYLKMATQVSNDIISRGKMPIFVGGTGLYLKALEFGLADIPNIEKILFDELNNTPVEQLYAELTELDNAMAKTLKSTDKQRIIRALGVVKQTGIGLLDWQSKPNKGMLNLDFIHLAINPEREIMYDRINKRAQKMIEQGVIKEVESVINKYGKDNLNSLTSIGFDVFLQAFNNEIRLEEACDKFAQKQRNYAKRQITWLNHQYPVDYTHVNLNDTINFIKNNI